MAHFYTVLGAFKQADSSVGHARIITRINDSHVQFR